MAAPTDKLDLLDPSIYGAGQPSDSSSAPNVVGPKTMLVKFSPGRRVNS
jgi:hypothetical protein